MSVSIVQLTYNNLDQVRRYLTTVAWMAARDEVVEWIVFDNGSTDGTPQQLEEFAKTWPKLRVIASDRNLGCGGGRNVALRQAVGDVVLSMDSDVDVTRPSALAEMLADLERPGVAVVGQHGGHVKRDWTWTEEVPPDYVGLVPIVCGFAQLFRRSVLDVWVLPEGYPPYWLEDSDFCLQLQEGLDQVGWVGNYGLVHQWSNTSANEADRKRTWKMFRKRWRASGLEVHR
jgi:glycosyltransferase involved in cell wall biosynthesis